ncbi:MAG TPA: DUF1223 domain-containing protein [Myxococcales bacterium]|nr:DUF1223 domain-containing protein [Myxococcales bacterium]
MSRVLGVVLLAAALPAYGGGRVPVLIELFTSEGCSSCPPADALLAKLVREQPVEGVEILALSEHVDYWDSLGWRDPYSSPVFTRRQEAYGSLMNRVNIYTPQAIVDGRTDVLGTDERAIRKASSAAAAQSHGTIDGRRSAKSLHLDAAVPAHRGADVFLAAVDDPPPARVERGENAGRTLSHVRVVRVLKQIGKLDQANASFDVDLDAHLQQLRLVAFVQERTTGRVLAAGTWAAPSAGM